MGGIWPSGLSRGRRAALLVVDGLALWLTALLIDLYSAPATWNIAGSAPEEIIETARVTTLQWATQPPVDLTSAIAYLGGILVLLGVGWYGLLRPVLERYTEIVDPISDPVEESETP